MAPMPFTPAYNFAGFSGNLALQTYTEQLRRRPAVSTHHIMAPTPLIIMRGPSCMRSCCVVAGWASAPVCSRCLPNIRRNHGNLALHLPLLHLLVLSTEHRDKREGPYFILACCLLVWVSGSSALFYSGFPFRAPLCISLPPDGHISFPPHYFCIIYYTFTNRMA